MAIRKFLISLLFVLAALFAVDRIGGKVMWWVTQHTHDVSGPKIRYLVNDVNEDVVLMGASRCNLHYVPSIISDTLGMSVYNGGVDASDNIYAHTIVLDHILKRHTPKVICLEVMAEDFSEGAPPFNTVSFFAPYFGMNCHADSIFRQAGMYWPYKFSHLYRYNAKAVSNIAGLAVNRQNGGDNGYIPVPEPRSFPTEKETRLTSDLIIDDSKINHVRKFIDKCKEKNIELIFVISPMYSDVDIDYYDTIKSIAREKGIVLLDYHTSGLFLDKPEYFKDPLHLWDKSARLYSSLFASDLKRCLN